MTIGAGMETLAQASALQGELMKTLNRDAAGGADRVRDDRAAGARVRKLARAMGSSAIWLLVLVAVGAGLLTAIGIV